MKKIYLLLFLALYVTQNNCAFHDPSNVNTYLLGDKMIYKNSEGTFYTHDPFSTSPIQSYTGDTSLLQLFGNDKFANTTPIIPELPNNQRYNMDYITKHDNFSVTDTDGVKWYLSDDGNHEWQLIASNGTYYTPNYLPSFIQNIPDPTSPISTTSQPQNIPNPSIFTTSPALTRPQPAEGEDSQNLGKYLKIGGAGAGTALFVAALAAGLYYNIDALYKRIIGSNPPSDMSFTQKVNAIIASQMSAKKENATEDISPKNLILKDQTPQPSDQVKTQIEYPRKNIAPQSANTKQRTYTPRRPIQRKNR